MIPSPEHGSDDIDLSADYSSTAFSTENGPGRGAGWADE